MTDIIPLFHDIPHDELTRRESFQSRFGWHGYYVFGEGGEYCDGINIYYDRDFDYIEGQPKYILDLNPRISYCSCFRRTENRICSGLFL